MMNYLLLIVLQCVIGATFGFYLSRAESNLSKVEIKLGVATVLVVAGVVLFKVDAPSAEFALMNLLSVASLLGGVMAGEWLHIRLVKHILRKVDKNMIFESVNDLIVQIRRSVLDAHQPNKPELDRQLVETLRVLNMAEQNARAFKQVNLAEKVSKLSELCEEFAGLGEELAPTNSKERIICSDMSLRIQNLAWETLRKMEVNVQKDLGKHWNTILYAVRAVHTRN